jgi:hypothetical protein
VVEQSGLGFRLQSQRVEITAQQEGSVRDLAHTFLRGDYPFETRMRAVRGCFEDA